VQTLGKCVAPGGIFHLKRERSATASHHRCARERRSGGFR
jgi:hypothetical protein